MNGDPTLLFHIFKAIYLKIFSENTMNFYQSVYPEKTLKIFTKKSGWVKTLQYLPFLDRAKSPIFFLI